MFNGQYIVTKEDYKRKMCGKMLSDNNVVDGSRRLIEGMNDRIQNNYGQAICNNFDDIDNVKILYEHFLPCYK